MLIQHLKVKVINRETALYEGARNKERKRQTLSAAAASGAVGRQGRSAMDVLPRHSEGVTALFNFRYGL